MDRECVSVLPRVCEVLAASGSSLPDDTSLEKLLDWFTALTKAGIDLLDACPCLLELISTVVSNDTASDPGILSFTLKLTGLLASTEDGFKFLQEGSVLDLVFGSLRWQEAGLWEDPCFRIGWIQGLRTMLQHSKAFSFFVQADFTEPLLQLQTDTSLFVASAANQMLAHVLLFCQSVSPPVGCHDTHQQTDSKLLTVPVEADQKYSTVVTEVCEFLKRSLVPKETSQLHRSQQVLKLLALLLTQAGPPLRDTLLLAVSDILEELVMTNYSQLTLPLMDVILAAHSCGSDEHVPDRRVARLLSSMLNVRKPADLVHAAAAFLRSGRRDREHRAQCAGVLLLPLDIITGFTLLRTNSTADQLRFSVMEQLKSKTSCVSMICVSLTNLPQAPDCLPCSPDEIIAAVLSLLKLCSGDFSPSSSGCAEVFRSVTSSGRVQKCALDALSALSSSSGIHVMLVEVFTLLIQYLNSPASDPTVIQKSYQVLIKWISVCSDLSDVTDQIRADLLQVVRKRVCDVRWEVRDSTVEFLGHLASQTSAYQDACEFLLGGRCVTVPLLQEALQDPESYVRASSVSALALTLAHSWHRGAGLAREEADIVTRLLEILSQDTEGFSRRAVVRFFLAWFSSCSSPSSCSLLTQSVPTVLSRGMADLDWEVKVHTLELAELLLNRASESRRHPYAVTSNWTFECPSHTEVHTQAVQSDSFTVLNSLVDQGVFSALLSGLVDCDRPVGLKACQLLIRLRDTVCPLLLGDQDACDALLTDSRASGELPGCGWAREVRRMLRTTSAAMSSCDGADGLSSEDCCEEEEEDHTMQVGVCKALRRLGLDERLSVLTQSSDHVHNSPLSLLQDILTASRTNAHLDSQEVIVDCY